MRGASYTVIKRFGKFSTNTLEGLENGIRKVLLPADAFGASRSLNSELDTTAHEKTAVFATVPEQFCDAGRKFEPYIVTALLAYALLGRIDSTLGGSEIVTCRKVNLKISNSITTSHKIDFLVSG